MSTRKMLHHSKNFRKLSDVIKTPHVNKINKITYLLIQKCYFASSVAHLNLTICFFCFSAEKEHFFSNCYFIIACD